MTSMRRARVLVSECVCGVRKCCLFSLANVSFYPSCGDCVTARLCAGRMRARRCSCQCHRGAVVRLCPLPLLRLAPRWPKIAAIESNQGASSTFSHVKGAPAHAKSTPSLHRFRSGPFAVACHPAFVNETAARTIHIAAHKFSA